jgi:putative ABC transport system permease protein
VRIALGGTARSVVLLIARSSARVAGLGIAIGAALAFALTRGVSSLLYDTDPLDPSAVAAGAIAFVGIVALTAVASASRAAAVDPADALRSE